MSESIYVVRLNFLFWIKHSSNNLVHSFVPFFFNDYVVIIIVGILIFSVIIIIIGVILTIIMSISIITIITVTTTIIYITNILTPIHIGLIVITLSSLSFYSCCSLFFWLIR